jgi:hypothetical protein
MQIKLTSKFTHAVLFPLLVLFIIGSCKNKTSHSNTNYSVRDYITVGKMMDTIRPPYVIDVANGSKHIVFIGCDHNNDSTHPQFKIIEKYANELKPQIVFNEGGQVPDSIHYISLNQAAFKNGEIGTLKYCADKLGISMLNGDTPFKTELSITLKKYSKEELYLYYIVERFVVPYRYGGYGKQSFNSVFTKEAIPYLLKNEFPLSLNEQGFSYYKQLYKQKLKQDFDVSTADLEAFDYINDNCHFCALGRTSKIARDSMLLGKIANALKTYDRVMITFGHGHALAVEPALKQLIAQASNEPQ